MRCRHWGIGAILRRRLRWDTDGGECWDRAGCDGTEGGCYRRWGNALVLSADGCEWRKYGEAQTVLRWSLVVIGGEGMWSQMASVRTPGVFWRFALLCPPFFLLSLHTKSLVILCSFGRTALVLL